MSKYDVVLFDMDGTLTDSKGGIIRSFLYAARFYGIEDTEENLLDIVGPPLNESFMRHYGFDRKKADEAVEKYREHYVPKGMFDNCLYSGILELLQTLRENNKTIVLATSKPTLYSEMILIRYDLRKYFDFLSGSNLDNTHVDKAEVIQTALDALKLQPSKRIAMVGDRKYDIIGAQQTGVASIAELYGYGSLVELQAAAPDVIVKNVQELREELLA